MNEEMIRELGLYRTVRDYPWLTNARTVRPEMQRPLAEGFWDAMQELDRLCREFAPSADVTLAFAVRSGVVLTIVMHLHTINGGWSWRIGSHHVTVLDWGHSWEPKDKFVSAIVAWSA